MNNNQSIASKVLHELKDLGILVVQQGEPEYYYSRQISNTRMGHMPDFIVYCKTAEDVQHCIVTSNTFDYPFRVRSGGHQHEGMCSGNQLMIIDLSQIYDKTIKYPAEDQAWIPVGKQLQQVYSELELRGQTIPGGGCQSVNVGGLTQGGGWGISIRKFGLTCDNILEAEVILSSGKKVIASKTNEPNLFWSLKGGGGGNFGIVTRFKFQLSSYTEYTTSFAIRWTKPIDVPTVVKKWIDMHMLDFEGSNPLDPNISCTAGLFLNKATAQKGEEIPECTAAVSAGIGGFYYGRADKLLELLKLHFKDHDGKSLLPLNEDGTPNLNPNAENRFARWEEVKKIKKKDTNRKSAKLGKTDARGSETKEQQLIADFMNPVTISGGVSTPSIAQTTSDTYNPFLNCDRDYNIIPNAPSITCDQPHPHKVTSGFPKKGTDHHALVDQIYHALLETKYYPDVSKYMIWHCFGGAVLKTDSKDRAFPFADKPYLLQLQCWWDDAGDPFDDMKRNVEYVKWVNDFRTNHMKPHCDGAFINFVDKDLVSYDPDQNETERKLEILKHYYGENLDQLRKNKANYDPDNRFNFELSIPPM